MSYKLERFGLVTLPIYDPETVISSAPSRIHVVEMPGGYFDTGGGEQALPDAYQLTKSGLLMEETPEDLQAAFNRLKALRGKRDQLYRRQRDGTFEWAWARLVQVSSTQLPKHVLHLPVDLTFQVLPPLQWFGEHHGTGWFFNQPDPIYFDSGRFFNEGDDTVILDVTPKTVVVTNGGNAVVRNAVITVTAGGTPITALNISKSGETDLSYSGTIPSGQSVVLDCGALSVKNNGFADYAHLAVGANHKIDGWLRLDPGINSIVVTRTGGGGLSSITVQFYEAWE